MTNARDTRIAKMSRMHGASPTARARLNAELKGALWTGKCRVCGTTHELSSDDAHNGCPTCKGDHNAQSDRTP